MADLQQVYDVAIPNDRLVLQIKGTIAKLELTSLKTRLRAGIEAKAARGELKVLLPPGYLYDANDQLVKAFAGEQREYEQAIERARLRVHERRLELTLHCPSGCAAVWTMIGN